MSSGSYADVSVQISQVHRNTNQEVIQITDDKLRLILKDHLHKMERRKDWIAPLGVLIAVISVFVSASFKDALGLPAATWSAIFVIFGLASLIWLVRCLAAVRRSPTLDDVVNAIKNSTPPIP
jgi:hypothetical protein